MLLLRNMEDQTMLQRIVKGYVRLVHTWGGTVIYMKDGSSCSGSHFDISISISIS